MFICKFSINIIWICRKLGLVGRVQQNIKLPLHYLGDFSPRMKTVCFKSQIATGQILMLNAVICNF